MSEATSSPKAALIDRFLLLVPFHGWNDRALAAAVRETGLDEATVRELVPGRARALLGDIWRDFDAQMADRLGQLPLAEMKVREKIKLAVLTRLEVMQMQRDAMARGAERFLFPGEGARGLALVGGTADRIWRAIGDTSTDYNYYTKRAILTGVLLDVLRTWFRDESADMTRTRAVLDRHIAGVMSFEKIKSRAIAAAPDLALPIKMVSALRYPGSGRRVRQPTHRDGA